MGACFTFWHFQIVYSLDDPSSFNYCKQVTIDQYENQRLSHSQRALVDLLEGIVRDKTMGVKDKRKRLKQVSGIYHNCSCHAYGPLDDETLTKWSHWWQSICSVQLMILLQIASHYHYYQSAYNFFSVVYKFDFGTKSQGNWVTDVKFKSIFNQQLNVHYKI